MNFGRGRAREDPDINLIPLIDILIVILIFLFLTTTYSRFAELQINLPEASAEKSADKPAVLNVAVDASGKYAINGVATPYGNTQNFAQALQGRRQGRQGARDRDQRRCRRHAPVRDQRDGKRAHRRLHAHLLHDADASLGRARSAVGRWLEREWQRLGGGALIFLPFSLAHAWRWSRCAASPIARGLLPAWRARVPVIVVGNITVGGTGKTPLTLAILEVLDAARLHARRGLARLRARAARRERSPRRRARLSRRGHARAFRRRAGADRAALARARVRLARPARPPRARCSKPIRRSTCS